VLIGKPVANTYLYILDPFLQLVPPGVTGELYIGGVQLARGYLNREQLTAEKFIDDPYNTGKRLYRTGDLCRWTPDGNIEYLGRIDDQVKIRGYRIELKEVEQALCALEGVSTAVVTVGGNNNGERYLAAHVVSPAGHQPATLKQQLLERLPAYMVPSCFMMLDKLPVTANGKVDKRALPDPSSASLAGESHVPPRTETEIALAGIYEGSLNRPGISVTDNFFDLGITSLLLIKIRAAIRKQFGLQLNVHELYKTATIEELAATIDSLLWLKESTNNNIQQFEEFTI
jgi:iturin family lipopeptide synthetase B